MLTRFTPRQRRAIDALLPGAWIAREALDSITGAANSPETVAQLRRHLGQEAIETQHMEAVDRDGQTTRPGRYRLTAAGRVQLRNRGGAA